MNDYLQRDRIKQPGNGHYQQPGALDSDRRQSYHSTPTDAKEPLLSSPRFFQAFALCDCCLPGAVLISNLKDMIDELPQPKQ